MQGAGLEFYLFQLHIHSFHMFKKISLHPHYPVKLSHLMIIKEISSLIRCRDVSVDSSVQNLNFVFLYESFRKKRSSYGESWKIAAILQICPGPGSGHSVFLILS